LSVSEETRERRETRDAGGERANRKGGGPEVIMYRFFLRFFIEVRKRIKNVFFQFRGLLQDEGRERTARGRVTEGIVLKKKGARTYA